MFWAGKYAYYCVARALLYFTVHTQPYKMASGLFGHSTVLPQLSGLQ